MVNNNQRFKLSVLSRAIRHAIPCMYREIYAVLCESEFNLEV